MFKRQKYLISQIVAFGGECNKIHLVKSLFYLVKQDLEVNLYDFHPHFYGPYSEVIYADLNSLQKKKMIEIIDNSTVKLILTKQEQSEILKDISPEHFYKIQHIASRFKKMDFKELLEFVYKEFPYYAINNQTLGRKYTKYDPRRNKINQDPKIFTIGYEGTSIDEFFNNLIKNNIQILVDVRNNPWSMKYGFTGKTLKKLCEIRSIEYLSIKSLGIRSENRKHLVEITDYKKLFEHFEEIHMPLVTEELSQLQNLLECGKRIALLCFEKDINCCHRTIVAKHLFQHCNEKFEIEHIQ